MVSQTNTLKLAKAHAELEEVRAQPTGPTPEEVAAAEAQAKAEAKAKLLAQELRLRTVLLDRPGLKLPKVDQ